MVRSFVLAATILIFLGCAASPEQRAPQKEQVKEEAEAPPEEKRLPKDVGPPPVRPTCPPGMAGSC